MTLQPSSSIAMFLNKSYWQFLKFKHNLLLKAYLPSKWKGGQDGTASSYFSSYYYFYFDLTVVLYFVRLGNNFCYSPLFSSILGLLGAPDYNQFWVVDCWIILYLSLLGVALLRIRGHVGYLVLSWGALSFWRYWLVLPLFTSEISSFIF